MVAKQQWSICGVQLLSADGDREGNLDRATSLIRATEQNGHHDLYVLPELSSSGYGDCTFAHLAELAEDAEDGPSRQCFASLSRELGVDICYGFPRRRMEGGFAISQAVAAADGSLKVVYDKLHLCNMGACSERSHGFHAGSKLGVFETRGLRIGLTICYDLRFPELFSALRSAGCDVILHPSAFVRDATFPTYHPFVTTRAQENGCYMLSVTHAGPKFGSSIAAPPWVGPVPRASACGTAEEELKLQTLGEEEAVLILSVRRSVWQAVREAYRYREDIHPMLQPLSVARL